MKMNTCIYVVVLLALLSISCTSKKEKQGEVVGNTTTLFSLLAPEKTGVDFINKIENKTDFNIFKYRNFYNGGGVAIGDINNDGLPDIYLTGNMVANKLYLNKGNFQFEDISKTANVEGNKPWSTGVAMVDINADGLLDIYVSNAGNMEGNNHDNDLYINNGPSAGSGTITFTEKAAEYNLAKTGFSTHASFFDYDKDGDLDAYILNNSNIPVSSLGYAHQRNVRAQDWEGVPEEFKGVGDMLMRNDNGKFVDVSEEAGIYGSLIGFGLGVLVTDINKDLYPDIYISNDFYERDYLYINNQDGTFREEIKKWTSHLSLSAMGIDMGDINNDGHDEIFITDMLPEANERVKSVMDFERYDVFKLKQEKDFYPQYIQNTLQLNNGNGSFSEIAYFSGVDATDWSWAGLLFDMDNDGFKDIFITNGINHDLTDLDFVDFLASEIVQKMELTGKKAPVDSIIAKMPIRPQPNYAYKNNGDITFSNANKDWGFELPSMSNGAAYGDLDNDGDLDLIINNVNMNTFIYENKTDQKEAANYLKLTFEGDQKNKFAIGAKAILYQGDAIISQELVPFRGFQSSMDYTMTLGLGDKTTVDSLQVIWPNGKAQKLFNITANQTLNLKVSEADKKYIPKAQNKKTLLSEISKGSNLKAHKENDYTDFDYEGLIYKMLSQEGPSLAVADVDGDGNEDVFIGGAKGQPGVIYKHTGNGKLGYTDQKALQKDMQFEDTAAVFFDADADGDMDLMIGSGGNEVSEEKSYRARLYFNNGKGVFEKSEQELPSAFKNISTIAPYDFDADGDIDVFIGSRSVVGVFGPNPNHLFLENNGDGTFINATEKRAYELKDAGMITKVNWADMDGDSIKDLITISDWGTAQIYKNTGRRLTKLSTTLDSLYGWWNAILIADLDNDGDNDLVLGNQGSNIHYKPSLENPIKMWINDFDDNGTVEQIVTEHHQGKDYPIHQKRELTAQLVSLKKKNLKASEYSKRAIDELFETEIHTASIMKQVNIAESIIAVNNGNGKFSINKLPSRVQLSCVNSIDYLDIDKDGKQDLIMGGNNFEFKPQYSRLDAHFGNVLLGDGNMNFKWQEYSKSGFFIKEEVKHINHFKDKNGKIYLITSINNDKPKIFAINE